MNPSRLASTFRQDLSLRISVVLRRFQKLNYSAPKSRHSCYCDSARGHRSDPEFASQSVQITHGAVVGGGRGMTRMGFGESTTDHDETAPDAHERGADTTRALKASGDMNRGASLQSRARSRRGSHHCSCRARPTGSHHRSQLPDLLPSTRAATMTRGLRSVPGRKRRPLQEKSRGRHKMNHCGRLACW